MLLINNKILKFLVFWEVLESEESSKTSQFNAVFSFLAGYRTNYFASFPVASG